MTVPRLPATERFQDYLAARSALQKLRAAADYGVRSAEDVASSTNTALPVGRANWVGSSVGTVSAFSAQAGQSFPEVHNIASVGYGISYFMCNAPTLSLWQQDATLTSLQFEHPANQRYGSGRELFGSMVIFGSYEATDVEDERRTDAIRFLESQANISFARTIAHRLEELIRAAREEGSEPSSLSSLWGFIRLLIESPLLKRPSIALTPGGLMYARWKDEQERLFSVQFVDENKARFVVIRPNPQLPPVEEQFSGETTLDDLLDRARGVGGLEWVFEHER